MVLHYPLLLWVSAFAALLGSLNFGYQLAVLNTSLTQAIEDLDIPESTGTYIVTFVLVGALFGSLGAGYLADKYGPKTATLLTTIPFVAGSCISSLARSSLSLGIGRLICGVAVGGTSILAPRFLNEIGPTRIRGLLGSLNQLCINLGILLAFTLGTVYLHDENFDFFGVLWWRVMVGFGVVPAMLQCIVMASCPETPVWLLWSGLHLRARKSYRMLHGEESLEQTPVQQESNEGDALIERHVSNSEIVSPNRGGLKMFQTKYRRIMLLACIIPIAQQLSGINSIILYGSSVMKLCGLRSPIISNLVLGCVNTLFTILSSFLIDRSGRKAVLIISFSGMAVCLCILAISLLFSPSSPGLFVALVSLLGYTAFFGEGCGGVPWVYLSEILPEDIKASAQCLGTGLNWMANIFVGATFSVFVNAFGVSGLYCFYGCCCFVSAVFCHKYMIETKQKSLQEVHRILMNES